MLEDPAALVDYTLYWITCQDIREANYLLAIINSDVLYKSVESLMPKGQFGARHLQKTIARRELRTWLRGSPEGAAVEGMVGRLLGDG